MHSPQFSALQAADSSPPSRAPSSPPTLRAVPAIEDETASAGVALTSIPDPPRPTIPRLPVSDDAPASPPQRPIAPVIPLSPNRTNGVRGTGYPGSAIRPGQHLGRIAFDSTTPGDLPPPEPRLIQKLALYAFEVLEGARSAAQLGGWIAPGVATKLMERRAARVERRTLCNDRRRVMSSPGPVHLDRPSPNVVEATVVLYAEQNSTPVAMRFEFLRERWRITALEVI